MNEEIWKDVPGYEGSYQASTEGRIRSLDREIIRKDGKLAKYKGRVLSANTGVCLSNASEEKSVRTAASRVIAMTFLNIPQDDYDVIHIDGDMNNRRLNNLEIKLLRNPRASLNIGKPVKCIETGEIFNSATECANSLGTTSSIIGYAALSGVAVRGKHYTYNIDELDTYTIVDLPGEIWYPIKGSEDKYSVSNLGRVKSLKRDTFHKWSRQHVCTKTEHLIKVRRGTVGLFIGGKQITRSVKKLLHDAQC